MKQRPDANREGELRIEQTIFVSRESHRPIVLGKGGQTLKAIGEASRKELSEIFGEPVHLLHVTAVREWPARGGALPRDGPISSIEVVARLCQASARTKMPADSQTREEPRYSSIQRVGEEPHGMVALREEQMPQSPISGSSSS
ncbi:MAG: KH domain-containing protein [Parvularculaceae bacterium]